MAAAPDTGLPPGTAEAFAKMRQGFCAGLSDRWAGIEQARDKAERVAALHRLAGAAGSFGFPGLGVAAREAEAAVLGTDAALARSALDALGAMIRSLSASADGIRQSHPKDDTLR